MLPVNLSIFIALALCIGDLCDARVADYSLLDIQPEYPWQRQDELHQLT
jgi:hypothetical protein